jgi:hypothetical protein
MSAVEAAADIPAVAVRAAWHEVRALRAAVSQVNALLFNLRGVIAPAIDVRSSGFLARTTVVLNGVDLGPVNVSEAAHSIATILSEHADQLIVPTLVEFYLSRLQQRSPALVTAVRSRFSTAELVELLRECVRRNDSIRDLSGVLNIALERHAGL